MAPVMEQFPFFGPETFGLSPHVYYWFLLPTMIFTARIFDVSMDTVRIIYVNRGHKYLAPVIGFFQVLIWVSVISAIMSNLTHPHLVLAYAAGYATGNWVGMLIEEKLSVGLVVVHVITRHQAADLCARLRAVDCGVTSMEARGEEGEVSLLFTIIRRKDLEPVLELIKSVDPGAFVSVEDVRAVSAGAFPKSRVRDRLLAIIAPIRKYK
jgi:uncharacterized protein YebE (UPF0316 family)